VTAQTPIVFYAGADPVAAGLVEGLARPGGRLTGVVGLASDLTAKRLEVLKEMIPRPRRVVTFYDPDLAVSRDNARLGREAARQLGVQFVERHVRSLEELRRGLEALKPREVDAYFHTPDSLVTSQARLLIDTARGKRLATMFHHESLVDQGALASYGTSYREIGRMTAKYVQRILAGTPPKDLPVENYDKIELTLNLGTAREIGLTIPPAVRLRADRVIE
jgi:putative ABC transport system substrate-binding protein